MDKKSFYVGALLHDIGKFAQRANAFAEITFSKDDAKYMHAAVSAEFVNCWQKQGHPLCDEDALNLALFHHVDLTEKGRVSEEKAKFVTLIRIADWLSSSERTKDENIEVSQQFATTPLISIFQRLFEKKEEKTKNNTELAFSLKPLSLEKDSIFPHRQAVVNPSSYKSFFEQFQKEFSQIKNIDQLYYLLEKYTWCIPSATPWGDTRTIPDVSLFDHSRTTAAIALCLYDEFVKNRIADGVFGARRMDQLPDENHFVLALVDFSGIQEFIYSISSKRAARSLKGRSLFLDLFSEIVAAFFVRKLELEAANILYNGGGNFYLLLPKSKESKLDVIYRYVSMWLLKAFQGKIYLALGKADLVFSDFADISNKWGEVHRAAGKQKYNRFKEIDFIDFFEPFEGEKDEICSICHVETQKLEALDEETMWCPMCKSFGELAKNIKRSNLLELNYLNKVKPEDWEKVVFPKNGGYLDFFRGLDYEITFLSKNRKAEGNIFILNDTNFIGSNTTGFKFGVFAVPLQADGKPLMFDEIAEIAEEKTGTKKLALLKMDVDNLGRIFAEGLEKNDRTISRIASLSRQLRMFFEGYLNTILSRVTYKDKIYAVYSGGDDTFLIGPWNLIFQLAKDIRSSFAEYTCHNPNITISASITVVDEKFPVIRAAQIAESSLHEAKTYRQDKNSISVFGQIFGWDEYGFIEDLKNKIVELIKERGESRGLLQKIMNSTRGFSKLLDSAASGKILTEKLWRFAYYLRTVDRRNKERADELLAIYEQILINQLLNSQKKKSIMIIPVACRWAELETRNTAKY